MKIKSSPASYALSIASSPSTVELTVEQICQHLDESISELTTINDYNRLLLASNVWPHFVPARSDGRQPYYICIPAFRKNMLTQLDGYAIFQYNVGTGPIRQYDVERINKCIRHADDILARCTKIRSKLTTGGRLSKSDTFIIIDRNMDSSDPTYYGKIRSVSAPITTECQSCGTVVQIKRLGAHSKTRACADLSKRRNLEKRGYSFVPLRSVLHNLAINGIILDAELIPTEYAVWVPSWIIKAQEAYGSGYGGMTLADFISKMRPTEDANAQKHD